MDNLKVQLSVEVLPSHQDRDDPEEGGEEEVEGAEENVEPPDWRHTAIVLGAGHQLVSHDDRVVLAPVTEMLTRS